MLKKDWFKKIAFALLIVAAGFILLILAFILNAGLQSLFQWLFYPKNEELMMILRWLAPLQHILFVVVIGLISWVVFRTKWPAFVKAIYLTVPVAVALVTLGMFTYQMPVVTIVVGLVLILATLYLFYRLKLSWLYFFSLIFWSLVLTIFTFTGGQI